jgi:hypothetical protein
MRNRDTRGGDLRPEYGQPPGLVAVGRLDVQGAGEDGDGASREMDAVAVERHPHDAAPGRSVRRRAARRAGHRIRRHAGAGCEEAGAGRVAHRSGLFQAFGNCGGSHFRGPEIHCDHVVEVAIHHEGSATVRKLSVPAVMIVQYRT